MLPDYASIYIFFDTDFATFALHNLSPLQNTLKVFLWYAARCGGVELYFPPFHHRLSVCVQLILALSGP